MSKIQDFCRRYFKTELTQGQLELIEAIADNKVIVRPRGFGVTFTKKVVRAYLRDGLKEPTPRLRDHLFVGTSVQYVSNSYCKGKVIGTRIDPSGKEYHVEWIQGDSNWYKRSDLIRVEKDKSA